jgi:hypothetical protein
MISVKANISRFSLLHLSIAICFSLFGSTTATGQTDPDPMMQSYPPWACDDQAWTGYNYAVGIDVLMNDFPGSLPIDPSTLTIVNQPASGQLDIDPVLGLILYTPDENVAGYDEFQYKVADTEGNFSNDATVGIWVHNDAPSITLDYTLYSGNTWIFEGNVTDENPAACKVTFGGILDGKTAEVDDAGYYFLSVELETGVEGVVTAQTTDEVGEASNVAETYFHQY